MHVLGCGLFFYTVDGGPRPAKLAERFTLVFVVFASGSRMGGKGIGVAAADSVADALPLW